jgi:hypothetical protein
MLGSETRPQVRVQFENLAKAHLRLAEQADLLIALT